MRNPISDNLDQSLLDQSPDRQAHAKVITTGGLPPSHVLRFAIQFFDGMSHALAKGIRSLGNSPIMERGMRIVYIVYDHEHRTPMLQNLSG